MKGQQPNGGSTMKHLASILVVIGLAILAACSSSLNAPSPAIQSAIQSSPQPALKAKASTTFNNPLASSGADPFMTFYNGFYYLLYTTNGSTIQVRKAASVAALASTAETQVWNDTDVTRDSFHWAPELHLINGPNGNRWYIYYTAGPSSCCGNQRLYVLESAGTDPLGPYTFKGQLLNTYSIDSTVLSVGSNLYAIYARVDNGNSVEIIKLSNPWTTTGSPTRIAEATAPWERQFGIVNEAPAAIVRGGKIFLTFSANDCSSPNYSLGLLTANESSNLLSASSWVKTNGAVFKREDSAGVYGPGHNGFFKSPDGTEDWIIYHAVTNPNGSCGGDRSTRIQKFTWNSDGTPNFGVPIALSVAQTLPSGDPGSNTNSSQTRYEAELGTRSGLAQVVNESSASNGKKVGYIDDANSGVSFNVNVSTAGQYKITVRYSNGWGNSSHNISVNNGTAISLSYANNGVNVWTSTTLNATLNAGSNTIKFAKGNSFTELDFIEVPAQPEANVAALPRYEAESATLNGLAQIVNESSASNGKKVGYIDDANSSVSFKVNAVSSGQYPITVRYSNGWGSSSHNVSVNNGTASALSYANNGINVWTSTTLQAQLNAGENTIKFSKGSNFTELDYLELPRYEAENATLTGLAQVVNVPSASNGKKVGYIDDAGSSASFKVNVPNAGGYTLRVRYANGWGNSTHNLSVNNGAATAITYANNGINNWTSTTVAVSLNAGENTIKFSKGDNFTELDYIDVYK
jgi:GH43 family beta-xylosidase